MAKTKRELEIVITAKNLLSRPMTAAEKKVVASTKKMEKGFKNVTSSANLLRNSIIALMALRFARGIFNTIGELEKGWINIAKTTGMAGKELDLLKNKIRSLSTEMRGISIEEFQEIAIAAGQLGIRGAENIAEFTRVIGMVGVTTDLGFGEAAKTFAKFSLVMDEPIAKVEILASVMNELSNTTPATAAEIMDISNRFGAVAKILGIASDQVMGLSASLVAFGVPLNVAGTATSQIFMKMATDSSKFAKAVGLDVEELTNLIQTDAMAALKAVAIQLNKLSKEQVTAAGEAITELGLDGMRTTTVLLKMASGMKTVEKNLRAAADEAAVATSIQKEYDAASQGLLATMEPLWNAIKLTAEATGELLTPALKEVVPWIVDVTVKINEQIRFTKDMVTVYKEGTEEILAGWAKQREANRRRYAEAAGIHIKEISAIEKDFTETHKLLALKKLLVEMNLDKAKTSLVAQIASTEQAEKERIAQELIWKNAEKSLIKTRKFYLEKSIIHSKDLDQRDELMAKMAQQLISQGWRADQAKRYIAILQQVKDMEDSMAAEEKIDAVVLATERLNASKERLLELQVREFELTGATAEQQERYRLALEEQAAVEEKTNLFEDKLAALNESLFSETNTVQSNYDARRLIVESAYQDDIISKAKRDKIMAGLDTKEKKEIIRREIQLTRYVARMRSTATNLAIGLLRAIPNTNREMAIAVIAVEKGLAIARTIMNTHAGAAAAMAIGPAGAPASAAILQWGYIQAGIIAATGLAQMSGVGAGSGGAGASIPTDDRTADTAISPQITDLGQEAAILPQQVIVNINVDNMISSENLEEIVEEQIIPLINDAADRDINIVAA